LRRDELFLAAADVAEVAEVMSVGDPEVGMFM
jgi:hypothetical protein